MRFGKEFLFGLYAVLLTPAFAWAQEAAVEVAEHVSEEGGSSMPQLDPTYYPSQLFWLAVSGIILYILMAKIALPRVSKVVDQRDDQVRQDLEKAAKLRQEAESIKVVYMRSLRDADERARSLTDRVVREIKVKQTVALEESMKTINASLLETETRLRSEKDALLDNLDTVSEKLTGAIVTELSKKRA